MGIFAKIFRVPSILHGRGTDLNYDPFFSLKSNLLARIACKINKKIITVSKTMKSDVMKLNVPENKITYIYDGLDFSKFTPKKIKDFSNNKTFEMIHANRFSPEKCQDLIIEVCRELKENNVNFRLTMIGYGPLENVLKTLIKKYHLENCVIMGGFIEHDKVPLYLQNADLYVQPSLTEGMPKSVYEAMSMELPVVITNVGGMSELNVNPGVFKIEKNNKKQLYDAIIHFMTNCEDRKIGGKKNREYVLKNFNWDLHSKKLHKIYLELKKK
jgi:glycosyltransferase involved in cell wall biosynthesis